MESKIRTYSEMSRYSTFLERYRYLRLPGSVGIETFGFDRYLNQRFYGSREWKSARNEAIRRDLGNDLGIDGYPINAYILVHHMNPISVQQVRTRDLVLFDPEFLITTTRSTHNAIHYGDESLLDLGVIERRPGDTQLW